MHLVACNRPQEPFEDAPRTGLLADRTDGERWDGFWAEGSDDYFVRCTRLNGATEWFRVEDDAAVTPRGTDARVLELPTARRQYPRVAVIVAQSPAGRRVLVGSTRRNRR